MRSNPRAAFLPVFLLLLSTVEAGAAGSGLVVFSTTFDGGLPAEFGGAGALESVAGYAESTDVFTGLLLRNDVSPALPTTLTLTGLPEHTGVDVRFLLALIDTWDGDFSVPMAPAPDIFSVRVDGGVIFSETFSTYNDNMLQSYSPPPGGLLTPTPFVDLGWQPRLDFGDAAYDMGVDPAFLGIAHTADTLHVEFTAGGAGWQGGLDESWGLENVVVTLHGVPGSGVEAHPSGDGGLSIAVPHPNPFRSSSSLSIRNDRATPIDLWIVDVAGRSVRNLVNGRHVDPGVFTVTWNGRDDRGRLVAPGTYFFRVRTPLSAAVRKTVLIR